MNAHVPAWAFVRVYLVYRVSPEPRNANRATKFRAFFMSISQQNTEPAEKSKQTKTNEKVIYTNCGNMCHNPRMGR